MTRIARILVLAAAIPCLLAVAAVAYGQPSIPREKIPADAPAEVRAAIEELYAADQGKRAEGAIRLAALGSRAGAAVPFLIAMLGEDDNVTPDRLVDEWFVPLDKLARIGYRVAEALGSMGPAAADPLVDALEHGAPAVRARAAYALGKIPGSRFSDALFGHLKDPAWNVREDALAALADRRDPRSFDALVAALRDEHWIVRRTAVDKLAVRADPGAVAPIAAAFEAELQTEAERRKKAGVDEFGSAEPREARLETIHLHFLRSCLNALTEIRDARAVEALLRALKLRMPVGEKRMQRSLAGAPPPDGPETASGAWDRERLLAFFKSDDPAAMATIRNLSKVRGSYGVPPLLDALKDEDPFMRLTVAGVLGGIRDPRIVPSLIPMLSDNSAMVRGGVAVALARIQDPAAVEPLFEALGTEEPTAHRQIAGALGVIGGTALVPRLEETLKDPRPAVRDGASIALQAIRTGLKKAPGTK